MRSTGSAPRCDAVLLADPATRTAGGTYIGASGAWLTTNWRVTSRGEEPVLLAGWAVLIGQPIARGHSRERAGHVEPGRGAVMGSSACSTILCLIHASCSARTSFSSFVVGCALVRARPGSIPIRTSVRRPILRRAAISGVLVPAISCVRYPEDAPRPLRRGQVDSGARRRVPDPARRAEPVSPDQ
jgi:hypothetical protein